MSDAAQPTASDVRAAAEAVKAAIDRHLAAIENRTGDDDPEVYEAFDALATAAEVYDELLYEVHDEVTPFEVPAGDALPAYTGTVQPPKTGSYRLLTAAPEPSAGAAAAFDCSWTGCCS